ncbi:MAG: 50S ribosomal protein L22 [Bacteroidota bacterium]|jgi:large subunit ribosomal protein L22|nr:50S ribosomal protein L22 [Bacteroidota bacterium]MCA6443033.1 50S ribosomal protein L22 [Bacteroidota bacterium]
MGKRKRLVAEARKEANKTSYFAKLNSCPTSPRKMRQVADLVRGMDAYQALNVLKFNTREASGRLEKLLKSAIANYEAKSNTRAEEGVLFVKSITVDSALMQKRLRTAPQGRGYRIRKRSNHVTLVLDTKK